MCFLLLMLTFCFPNIYIGHVKSSNPIVTDSLTNVRGEWVPNFDDKMLVSRLSMVFDRVEDCLEFYKKDAIYVGLSIRSGLTEKNKSGKCWKRYVCPKEGFCKPAKTPEIATIMAKAMSQAIDGPNRCKLEEKRVENKKRMPSSYSFEVD